MAFLKSRAGTQFDPQIVELLGQHFLELEEKARQQIGHIVPLKTDITIVRGAAPGAGFEPEHQAEQAQDLAECAPELAIAASTELARMLDQAAGSLAIFSILTSHLQALVPHDCFAVHIRTGDVLAPQFTGGASAKTFSMQQIPLGEGLSGWVAEHARPIVNGNPTVEPNYAKEFGLLDASSSALSVPLFARDGSVLGVITLYAAAGAAFSKHHLGLLEKIEPRLSQALQRSFGFTREGKTLPPFPDASLVAS